MGPGACCRRRSPPAWRGARSWFRRSRGRRDLSRRRSPPGWGWAPGPAPATPLALSPPQARRAPPPPVPGPAPTPPPPLPGPYQDVRHRRPAGGGGGDRLRRGPQDDLPAHAPGPRPRGDDRLRRHLVPLRHVLQPAVAGPAAPDRHRGGVLRQARALPGQAPDDEPGRRRARPHRREDRRDRADLPPVGQGRRLHLAAAETRDRSAAAGPGAPRPPPARAARPAPARPPPPGPQPPPPAPGPRPPPSGPPPAAS